MRRVHCPTCGVKVEQVPWGDGKSHLTLTFRWFLATWAGRLSWLETSVIFKTTWDNVFRSVKHAVFWGLAHRDTSRIDAIGVDEIQRGRGHHFLTLVYQINEGAKRLLWIAENRTEESLRHFFRTLTERTCQGIRFAASDMWRPYLNVIREQASGAIHVLDRFHVMANMNKAIDQVRREEVARLKADGYEPVLKHSRWVLLKRPENLTARQAFKLSELMRYNLRSVKARLLREDFQRFWEYTSPYWAGRFLDQWCRRTMRSGLEPMKRIARSLRSHRELLLNWFRASGVISTGTVEGFNTKAKLTTRKSYGFRTTEATKIALYHALGNLPEPERTHEFC
jgi:transposase